jgi:SAM-dependent methyltransferase
MNNCFGNWENIAEKNNLDVVADFILTGKKLSEFQPDSWVVPFIGNKDDKLKILDFGCGIGRNTFGMIEITPNWEWIGYDNYQMIKKTQEFKSFKYSNKSVDNVKFYSDWNVVKYMKFDCIYCALVLQHIYSRFLKSYLRDFKKMTKKIVVVSRRFNDEPPHPSTWRIIESEGLIPSKFYNKGVLSLYTPDGESEEHNIAEYIIR